MFRKCKHIRKIERLSQKTIVKETMLLSRNILKEFYCKQCGKLVASVVIQG